MSNFSSLSQTALEKSRENCLGWHHPLLGRRGLTHAGPVLGASRSGPGVFEFPSYSAPGTRSSTRQAAFERTPKVVLKLLGHFVGQVKNQVIRGHKMSSLFQHFYDKL